MDGASSTRDVEFRSKRARTIRFLSLLRRERERSHWPGYESHAHTHSRTKMSELCARVYRYDRYGKMDGRCSWACRLKSWLKHRERASQRWTRDPPARDNTWWDNAITVISGKGGRQRHDATFTRSQTYTEWHIQGDSEQTFVFKISNSWMNSKTIFPLAKFCPELSF